MPAPFVFGSGVAALLAFACLIASLPLTSLWSLGAAIGGLFMLTSIPWPRRGSRAIDPDAIADREVATAYGALLAAHAHLAAILAERDGSPWAKTVIGELTIGGDWAWVHGELATLGELVRGLSETVREPVHCELVAFADLCAAEPSHAADEWPRIRELLRTLR